MANKIKSQILIIIVLSIVCWIDLLTTKLLYSSLRSSSSWMEITGSGTWMKSNELNWTKNETNPSEPYGIQHSKTCPSVDVPFGDRVECSIVPVLVKPSGDTSPEARLIWCVSSYGFRTVARNVQSFEQPSFVNPESSQNNHPFEHQNARKTRTLNVQRPCTRNALDSPRDSLNLLPRRVPQPLLTCYGTRLGDTSKRTSRERPDLACVCTLWDAMWFRTVWPMHN